MAFVSLWMAAALSTVGQEGTLPATRVAVVNVPLVSERYLKTSDLEAQFEQRRIRFNERREALRQKVERTTRSLQEEFKPGTKEFDERRKQLALAEAELKWFVETEGQRIEQGLASSLRAIFNDIQAAIRELAREGDIDIVLAADQVPREPPGNTTQVRQQIVLQKVLYWHPRVDLTDRVVARLNAQYEAQRSAKPPAAAEP